MKTKARRGKKEKLDKVKVLEERLNDFEKRIFKEKSVKRSFADLWISYQWDTIGEQAEVKSLEEDFFDNLEELENKIDLILAHLKIEIVKKPPTESKLVVKKIKRERPNN